MLAAALVLALISSPPTEWDSAQAVGHFIQSLGVAGIVGFLALTAIATSVGLPRQFFAFTAGFAYGVVMGVVLSSIGAICGCTITFLCSRRWLSQIIRQRFPDAVGWLSRVLDKDVFFKILVLRLQPFGTNFMTNVCAGVVGIPAAQFLMSSWLGYIPQMMIFSLLGAGVRIGSNAYLLYSIGMICLSVAIGLWLYKKHIPNDV